MIAAFFGRRRFMREHRWTHSHMSAYIDYELGESGRIRVEEHTEICPQCHRILATLQRTVKALRQVGQDEPRAASSGVSSPVADDVIEYLRRAD